MSNKENMQGNMQGNSIVSPPPPFVLNSPVFSGKSGTSSNSEKKIEDIIKNLYKCIRGGNPETSNESEFTRKNVNMLPEQSSVQKRKRSLSAISTDLKPNPYSYFAEGNSRYPVYTKPNQNKNLTKIFRPPTTPPPGHPTVPWQPHPSIIRPPV